MFGKLSAIGDVAAIAVSTATSSGSEGEQAITLPEAGSLRVPLEQRFGTVFPSGTNLDTLAISLKSMVDKKAELGEFVQKLVAISSSERSFVLSSYRDKFKENLHEVLRGRTSGRVAHFFDALLLGPAEFDALELNRSVTGLGTDEASLDEVLFSRSAERIRAIYPIYAKKYGEVLSKAIEGDTSGYYCKLLMTFAKGKRRPDYLEAEEGRTSRNVQILFEGFSAQYTGIHIDRVAEILATESFRDLEATFALYEEKYNYGFDKQNAANLQLQTGEDFIECLRSFVQYVNNPITYFAKKIHQEIKNHKNLTRIIVTRSELDLYNIAEVYQKFYNKPLSAAIKASTTGELQMGLVALIEGNYRTVDADLSTLLVAVEAGRHNDAVKLLAAQRSRPRDAFIAYRYQQLYGKDLKATLGTALPSDHFEIVSALLSPRHEYLARLLHMALDASGVGADERALRDFLLSAIISYDAMENLPRVKTAYKKSFNSSLEADMKKVLAPELLQMFTTLMSISEKGDTVDKKSAQIVASSLKETPFSLFKKAENDSKNLQGVSAFVALLSSESREQVLEILNAYQESAHQPLASKVNNELQGLLRRSLLDSISLIQDRAKYIAVRIYKYSKANGKDYTKELKRLLLIYFEDNDVIGKFRILSNKTIQEVLKEIKGLELYADLFPYANQ